MSLFWNLGGGGAPACMQTSQCLYCRSRQERREGLEALQTLWMRGRRRRIDMRCRRIMMMRRRWRGRKKKLNNHIVEVQKDPISWIIYRLQPCLVCQISVTTVARKFSRSKHIEPAVPQPAVPWKYCKTDTSNSEYLVRNPVQAGLQSNKRLNAKHFFEYFWLGMILRPKGSRNLF